MVAADGKNRNMRRLPELAEIVRFMVQDDPANVSSHSGTGHLRKRCSTRRLKNDRIRTRRRGTLNEVKELLTLRNRVVAGMNNLEINPQASRSFLRRRRLLLLVIVVVVGQRD